MVRNMVNISTSDIDLKFFSIKIILDILTIFFFQQNYSKCSYKFNSNSKNVPFEIKSDKNQMIVSLKEKYY